MKYIFYLILLFSLSPLNAMHYPKLTAQEVESITDEQLAIRLAQEGKRVRAHIGEENFLRLSDALPADSDIQQIQELYERLRPSDGRADYRNPRTRTQVYIYEREVRTIFPDDTQIDLEILEFCGFAIERKMEENRELRRIERAMREDS